MVKKRSSSKFCDEGFTLIELMVVCTIFLLITSALYGLFTAGISAYAFNDDQALIQQNARAAIYRIWDDVKSAQEIGSSTTSSKLVLETSSNDITIEFNDANKTLSRKVGTGTPLVIAEYIEGTFTRVDSKFVRIKLTTKKGDTSYQLQTGVLIP